MQFLHYDFSKIIYSRQSYSKNQKFHITAMVLLVKFTTIFVFGFKTFSLITLVFIIDVYKKNV